jgi:threonine dehydrogenase-like Zn-dependent dehydrogenase
MKAARWHGRGDVRVQDVPQPEPGPGELLLPAAVQLLAEGRIRVRPLITGRALLERVVSDGFQALLELPDRHLKILIGPQL